MRSAMAASILISMTLLLGRLSGFIREALLASQFGTSASADAIILFLTLPDLMVGLLISGGVTAALLPLLKQHSGTDRVLIARFAGLVISFVFIGIAVVLSIFSESIISVFIPRVDFSTLTGLTTGFNLSLIALPITALLGVTACYLNASGRFAVPGLSVLVFNGLICASFLMIPINGSLNLIYFGVVVVLASFLRLLFQIIFMPQILYIYRSSVPIWPEHFIRKFVGGTLGLSVIVGAIVVFRSLHALNGEGEMAAFNYAHKLFELPAALLIAPLTIVLIQILSGLDISNQNAFEEYTLSGLLAALTLACIATALGWLYMPFAVRIIFGYGNMAGAEINNVTNIARVLYFALPFYAILQICASALNVQGRTMLVTINSCVGLISGVFLFLFLNFLGWKTDAASIGFVFFNCVATILCVFSLFGWKMPNIATLFSLIKMVLKICGILFVFLSLKIFFQINQYLIELLLICLSGLFMILVNYPLIKPMIAMKVTKD